MTSAVLRKAFANVGLGLVFLGADPLRTPKRVNPGARYRAMEEFFAASHSGEVGAAMMTSTASVQVNVNAGPRAGWPARVRLAHALGPTMIAIAANSPHAGRRIFRLAIHPAARVGPDGFGALRAHPGGQRRRPRHRLGAVCPQGAGDDGAQPGRRRGHPLCGLRRLGGRVGAARRPPPDHRRPGLPPHHPVPAGSSAASGWKFGTWTACRTRSGPRWCSRWSPCSTTPIAADIAAEVVEPVATAWDNAARLGLTRPAAA